MLHAALHWPEKADIKLWPFAMQHAGAYIWNHLPDESSGLAPIEILSKTRLPSFDCLRQLHVWGCPTFVLDPSLQDGKKLPKWKPRSRLGMYVVYAKGFASSVGYILNLKTSSVSPQYHVVHDDFFTTVPASHTVEEWDALGGLAQWQALYELGYERYVGEPADEEAENGVPPIGQTWVTEGEEQQQVPLLQREDDNGEDISDFDSDSSDDDGDDDNYVPPRANIPSPTPTPAPTPALAYVPPQEPTQATNPVSPAPAENHRHKYYLDVPKEGNVDPPLLHTCHSEGEHQQQDASLQRECEESQQCEKAYMFDHSSNDFIVTPSVAPTNISAPRGLAPTLEPLNEVDHSSAYTTFFNLVCYSRIKPLKAKQLESGIKESFQSVFPLCWSNKTNSQTLGVGIEKITVIRKFY